MSMDDANTLRNRGDVGPIFDARELGPIETAPRVRESALVAQTKHKKQLTRAEHAKTLRESKRAAFDKRFEIVETAIKEAEAEKWRKSDPTAKARASDVVSQLSAAVANYEAQALKAETAGNVKKASELREAAAARRTWLSEAEKGLSEFTN